MHTESSPLENGEILKQIIPPRINTPAPFDVMADNMKTESMVFFGRSPHTPIEGSMVNYSQAWDFSSFNRNSVSLTFAKTIFLFVFYLQ